MRPPRLGMRAYDAGAGSLHGATLRARRQQQQPQQEQPQKNKQQVTKQQKQEDAARTAAARTPPADDAPPESSSASSSSLSAAGDDSDLGEGFDLMPVAKRRKGPGGRVVKAGNGVETAAGAAGAVQRSSQTTAGRGDDESDEDPFAGLGSQDAAAASHAKKGYGKGLKRPRQVDVQAADKAGKEGDKGTAKGEKNSKKKTTPGFKPPPKLQAPQNLSARQFIKPRNQPGAASKGAAPARNDRAARAAKRSETKTATAPMNKSAAVLKVVESMGLRDHEVVKQAGVAPPKFKMPPASTSPATISSSATSTLSTPLSSPLTDRAAPVFSDTVQCGVCDKVLSVATYHEHVKELFPHLKLSRQEKAKGRVIRLNMRQQARFCRYHREISARVDWMERGYPQIEWDELAGRVQKMEPDIEKLIESGAQGSVFLDRIRRSTPNDDDNNSGDVCNGGSDGRTKGSSGRRQHVSKDLFGSLGAEDVGYYGGKGARRLGEIVVEKFNGKLRKAKGGPSSAIAAAGGITGFVERVLVPEVVVRLVMQDLGCDAERAREELVRGAELGKLLCEEENDEVEDDGDDNNDGDLPNGEV